MAYVRHNWTCGEVINDTRMNNIEDGIEEALSQGGAEPLVLNVVDTIEGTDFTATIYDKTGDQVAEAWQNGVPIYVDNYNLNDLNNINGFVPVQFFYNDEEDGVTLLINCIGRGEGFGEYTSAIAQLSEVPSSATGEEAQYIGHMGYYKEGGIS